MKPLLASGWACGGLICAQLLFVSLAAGQDSLEELPLPRWEESLPASSELQNSPENQLGGTLWPAEMREELEFSDNGLNTLPPPGTDRALKLFIPKTRPAADGSTAGESRPHPLVQVGAEFLDELSATGQEEYLMDPQTLLHETQAEDMRRLLAYHDGQSHIKAYYVMLETDQALPQKVDTSRLAGGQLAKGFTCLVAYPMNEPWRSRLFVSRSISKHVPPAKLRELVQACIRESLMASDGVEQLQRFAIQLSIRLIWLERANPDIFKQQQEMVTEVAMIGGSTTVPIALNDQAQKPLQIQESDHGLSSDALPEISLHAPAEISTSFWRDTLWNRWAPKVGLGAGALLAVILGIAMLNRSRRRSRLKTVWLLPECENTRRLGGPHCGGGGADLKYG